MKKLEQKIFLGLIVWIAALANHSAFAGIYDELSVDQKRAVQQGEQVFLTQDVSTSKWPKAFVYQRIAATPEEAAAVFFDIESQADYIPNLLQSKITKRLNSCTVEADYTLHVPIVSDENYTVRDTLSTYDDGKSYRIDWVMVRADSARNIVGNVRFETLGTGTLMAYYNFVTPSSGMAGLVKRRAMKQVADTADAIVTQVEDEKTKQSVLLQKQLKALREALGR